MTLEFYLPPPKGSPLILITLQGLKIILALGSAGVVAIIPGFIKIIVDRTTPKYMLGLKAGGAIAVFVFVMLIDPSGWAKGNIDSRVKVLEEQTTYNQLLEHCTDGAKWNSVDQRVSSDARDSCNTMIQLDPNDWRGYYYLARIDYIVREYKSSYLNYTEALNQLIDTNNIDLIQSRTLIRLHRGVAISALGTYQLHEPNNQKIMMDAKSSLKKALELFNSPNLNASETSLKGEILFDSALVSHVDFLQNKTITTGDLESVLTEWESVVNTTIKNKMWIYYHQLCALTDIRRSDLEVKQSSERIYEVAENMHNAGAKLNIDFKKSSNPFFTTRIKNTVNAENIRPGEPLLCKGLINALAKDEKLSGIIIELSEILET